jgi:hypothetical protein
VEFDHDPETDEKLQDILRQLHQMNVRIIHSRFYGTILGLHKPAVKKLEVIPGLFHVAFLLMYETSLKTPHYLLSDGRSAYWLGHGCGGFLCEDPDMVEALVEEDCGFRTDVLTVNSNASEFKIFDGEYYHLTMT